MWNKMFRKHVWVRWSGVHTFGKKKSCLVCPSDRWVLMWTLSSEYHRESKRFQREVISRFTLHVFHFCTHVHGVRSGLKCSRAWARRSTCFWWAYHWQLAETQKKIGTSTTVPGCDETAASVALKTMTCQQVTDMSMRDSAATAKELPYNLSLLREELNVQDWQICRVILMILNCCMYLF